MKLTIRVREVIPTSGPRLLLLTAFDQTDEQNPKEWAGTLTIEDKSADELRAAVVKMAGELADGVLRDVAREAN
jgi:hypothetical protein